ncbi:MAG: hypothetical protein ABI262_15125 [Microcoleus sp.]
MLQHRMEQLLEKKKADQLMAAELDTIGELDRSHLYPHQCNDGCSRCRSAIVQNRRFEKDRAILEE